MPDRRLCKSRLASLESTACAGRGLSDTASAAGCSRPPRAWPRGARTVSAGRLLGAASRPGPRQRPELAPTVGSAGPVNSAGVVGIRAALALELEGGVGQRELAADRRPGPARPSAWASSRLGWPASDQVGGERSDVARQAPHVQVVDLVDPLDTGDRGAQGGQVDVGGRGLEQDLDARPDQADGLDDDEPGTRPMTPPGRRARRPFRRAGRPPRPPGRSRPRPRRPPGARRRPAC